METKNNQDFSSFASKRQKSVVQDVLETKNNKLEKSNEDNNLFEKINYLIRRRNKRENNIRRQTMREKFVFI
jgi:hypothetical protein